MAVGEHCYIVQNVPRDVGYSRRYYVSSLKENAVSMCPVMDR